jgi:tetratricopeptide (TPR) repeat protein
MLSTSCANGAPAERWVEASSAHFIVLTDSSDKDARGLASQFERMHMVFHTLLPTPEDESDPPIMVVAVKDRKGLQALEPLSYLAKGQMDVAGLFLRSADKNYILVRLDATEQHAFSTVYHEYTHYMLRKADSWLPLWLNEGLAQFYENTDFDDKKAWLGEANAGQLRLLNRNNLIPIATLLAVDARSPYYHDEQKSSIFYAESWALTHYLIVSDRIQGTHRMHNYYELLTQGENSVTAAEHAFGDLERLQAKLNEYTMQRRFNCFMMPAVLAAKDAAVDVKPVLTTEADAIRADLLMFARRKQEARELIKRVLRDDPDNELANVTMGFLQYQEGDIAGAKDWYGKAVALDPNSYLARYYYAMAAMHDTATAEDATIESDLRMTIRLNLRFAPGYDTLALFYARRRRNLGEARELSARAVELEPGRLSFRLNLAEVLSQNRQFADALDALQSAVRLAKTPEEIEAVQARVAKVERYQTAIADALNKGHRESGFVQ